MDRIKEFQKEIEDQSQIYHPDDPSTFAVSTLLYPSKYCWFPGDGEVPSKHYDNKLTMMKELSYAITKFNNEIHAKQSDVYTKMLGDATAWNGADWPEWNVPGYKSLAPAFHSFGLRKRTVRKAGKKIGITDHRWSWWRET